MTDVDRLAAAARRAAERAYAPYSRFRVGAVVVAEDGSEFSGANVENSAYGSSICAEATAIATAASAGVRRMPTIAVACIDATDPGFPCGNCRQLMREFGVERVVVDGPDGPGVHRFDEDILPNSFGPESLES
ncbi:MAG: cytidine deaminase [Acidimicrobiia bacterium]|nr:cytidine deaminase [Acidimicrobiia bacterium]